MSSHPTIYPHKGLGYRFPTLKGPRPCTIACVETIALRAYFSNLQPLPMWSISTLTCVLTFLSLMPILISDIQRFSILIHVCIYVIFLKFYLLLFTVRKESIVYWYILHLNKSFHYYIRDFEGENYRNFNCFLNTMHTEFLNI